MHRPVHRGSAWAMGVAHHVIKRAGCKEPESKEQLLLRCESPVACCFVLNVGANVVQNLVYYIGCQAKSFSGNEDNNSLRICCKVNTKQPGFIINSLKLFTISAMGSTHNCLILTAYAKNIMNSLHTNMVKV